MAADCDCCAAGGLSVAKTFLEKRCNPTDDEVTEILAGHLCRSAAYADIIRTVKDTAACMHGEALP